MIHSLPILERMSKQSFITDPGSLSYLYNELPDDLPSLCGVVRGLVRHRSMGWLYGYTVPESEKAEADTREIELILARILQRNSAPLFIERPWEDKFVGYCRVSAVLLCSLARAKGHAICARAGFSAYAGQGIGQANWDHWICEYWNAQQQRWIFIDPEEDAKIQDIEGVIFDPFDIPRNLFVSPGEAWLAYRSGSASSYQFGLDEEHAGSQYIRMQLLRDIAAMNHWEATVLDCWGLGTLAEQDITSEELALLDEIAHADAKGCSSVEAIQNLYLSYPRLRAPLLTYH